LVATVDRAIRRTVASERATPGNLYLRQIMRRFPVSLASLQTEIDALETLTAALPLANLADIAQSTLIGRAAGAGTGDPTALTAAQVKTLLAIALGDISGFGANVATLLATFSSANLLAALTTKTGTGLNVFNDTPTLIAPTLGAALASSINVNSGGVISSLLTGTYTPTLTNTTNVAGSTSGVFQYMRLGNIVAGSGSIAVDPTTTGLATEIGISLPVASNFASAADLAGTAAPNGTTLAVINEAWGLSGDTTNDRAICRSLVGTASNHSISVHFLYRVI
jgi:hypothetical protein